MSTVATISPYESDQESSLQSSDNSADVRDSIAKAGTTISGSFKYDERQKEFVERYRKEQWKLDTKTGPLNVECSTLKAESAVLRSARRTMRFSSYESFVKPAESLGFKLSPLSEHSRPLENQPQLILTNIAGEKLVVSKNKDGRINVESNTGVGAIDKVNAKRSREMVEEYQRKNYRELQVEIASNGEATFVGVESRKFPDGQAKITTTIKNNGEVIVDVSNIQGKRCNRIIQGLASVLGSECTKESRKKEYFRVVKERGKMRA